MSVRRLALAHLWGQSRDWTRFAWQPFREGVEIARLYGEAHDGPSMALLRYAAGACVPKHVHHGLEHIFVLEGSQRDEGGLHEAGSLLVHGPGTSHSVASDTGCVVLAIWERPVELS
ncbi:MAG TPA: cupin domain-containing protein [Polyangiaceae bacterium]|nr:cupin domain-containing protein [Polyangiaceae bacterium]